MIYAANPTWDHEKFTQDFSRSECYHPPLLLTDAKDDTFLETTFRVRGNEFQFWLKNENNEDNPHKVWRHQHFNSSTQYVRKRAVIMGAMRKIMVMTSDADVMITCALQKLREFYRLAYPPSVLIGVCTYMAATTENYTWIKIREELRNW